MSLYDRIIGEGEGELLEGLKRTKRQMMAMVKRQSPSDDDRYKGLHKKLSHQAMSSVERRSADKENIGHKSLRGTKTRGSKRRAQLGTLYREVGTKEHPCPPGHKMVFGTCQRLKD